MSKLTPNPAIKRGRFAGKRGSAPLHSNFNLINPKLFTALVMLACSSVHAEPLQQRGTSEIAAFAAYSKELASNNGNGGLFVRIHTFPLTLGECWGQLESCPNIELAIAVSAGDLYEKPILLRLPPSKGWEFVQWLDAKNTIDKEPSIGFMLRTTIPKANIDQEQRTKFKAKLYEVWVSGARGSYEVR